MQRLASFFMLNGPVYADAPMYPCPEEETHTKTTTTTTSKSDQNRRELVFKVLVVGDIGAGKTAIVRRAVDNVFSETYKVRART